MNHATVKIGMHLAVIGHLMMCLAILANAPIIIWTGVAVMALGGLLGWLHFMRVAR